MISQNNRNHIYKIDKYNVPKAARDEFVSRATGVRKVLQKQDGFVRDFYLEQMSGSEAYDIVTIAEWENREAIEKAGDAVVRHFKETNFNPQEMYKQLEIETDKGIYKNLKIPTKQFINEN